MFSQNTLGNSAFASTAQKGTTNPNKDYEVTAPPEDSISALAFSPPSIPQNFLIAGSWDSQVNTSYYIMIIMFTPIIFLH